MVNVIRPCRIINSVCSCGRELGLLQHQIEFKLLERSSDFSTNDTDVSDILDSMGITKLCCRKTVLCSPVYLVSNMDFEVFKYRKDSGDIIHDNDELVINELLV